MARTARILDGKPAPVPAPAPANGHVVDPAAPADPASQWSITVKGAPGGRDTHVTFLDPRLLPNGERKRQGRAQLILLRLNQGVVPSADEAWALDATDAFIRRLLVRWDAVYPDTHEDAKLRGKPIPISDDDDPEYNPLDHVDGRLWDAIAGEVLSRLGPPKSP